MNTHPCCENSRGPTFTRRWVEVGRWMVPGAILALLPKCPMCLAAYVALWSGISLSLTVATTLRLSLLFLSGGLILLLVARNMRRLIQEISALPRCCIQPRRKRRSNYDE
jgi:hypothetical protein